LSTGSCARPGGGKLRTRSAHVRGTHYAVLGQEEIRHRRSEVEHAPPLKRRHDPSRGAQEPQVVVDRLELDAEDRALGLRLVVRAQDGQQLGRLWLSDADAVPRDGEQVEERVQAVAVVPREGAQRVRPVQEEHCVAPGEEVLCRRGATGACGVSRWGGGGQSW
jgi:hypothetical protein